MRALLAGLRAERPTLPWVLSAVSLLSLPNFGPLVWPSLNVARLLPTFYGVALLLLPVALGLLSARRWLQWCLPLAMLMPVVLAYGIVTHNPPREWAVLVLLETNMGEIAQFMLPTLIALAAMALIGWGYWRLVTRTVSAAYQMSSIVRALIIGFAVILPVKDVLVSGAHWGGRIVRERLTNLYPSGTLMAAWIGGRLRAQISARANVGQDVRMSAPAMESPTQPEVHVLVMGESARLRSYQLFASGRETMPLLAARKDLITFKGMVAPATVTLQSVPLLLTGASVSELKDATLKPSILTAFKRAGYAVHWLSTQMKHGMWDTTCSVFSNDADSAEFLSGRLAVGTKHYTSSLDGELLPKVKALLAKQEPRVLLVLHTMGNHFQYMDRYPPEFARYPADRAVCDKALLSGIDTDDERVQMTNAYDNTVLYTDHVLQALISTLESVGGVSTLTFISDHGENSAYAPMLPCAHGAPSVDVLEVPMLMWCSPDYQKVRADRVAALQAHRDVPMGAQALFHTVLDVAGLEGEMLQKPWSLARADFQPPPRDVITLDGDVLNYDQHVVPAESRGGWRPLSPKN
jgi:glucan phosphoethanolaminetransferase (alkaline phosphatase superfamily)